MSSDALAFTAEELDYLQNQHLGRLATVDASGAPQNNPVGFVLDPTTGQLDIGGLSPGNITEVPQRSHQGESAGSDR